jgi:hypothetical protein
VAVCARMFALGSRISLANHWSADSRRTDVRCGIRRRS